MELGNLHKKDPMSYSSEDVQQILQRALMRKETDTFSRDQLLEMASELGISADVLQAAELDWQSNRDELQERKSFNAFRRRAFKAHWIPYLAVNTFLILINLVTSPGYFWAIFPLLGWGLGLFFHGWSAYQTEGEAYEQAFEQWKKWKLAHRKMSHCY
jgi:hypothetical protein